MFECWKLTSSGGLPGAVWRQSKIEVGGRGRDLVSREPGPSYGVDDDKGVVGEVIKNPELGVDVDAFGLTPGVDCEPCPAVNERVDLQDANEPPNTLSGVIGQLIEEGAGWVS